MEVQSFLSGIQFIFWSVYAVAAILLAFYIPGNLITGKRSGFIFTISVGLVLWVWQGVIFGYLGFRFLTYLYLGTCAYRWVVLWFRQKFIIPRRPRFTKYSLIIAVVVILGVFGQTNRFIPTGFVFPQGVYIFTGASDDAFWHGALTNALVKNFPPQEPGLTPVVVSNYHYWSNMVIAEFVRVFGIPVMLMQFVYAPIFMSLLLGGISYVFMTDLGVSPMGKLIGLWLLYFASDVNYLISFITRKQFVFTVHPLEDGTMFWENPPRAVSFVVTLIGIVLLLRFIKSKKRTYGLLTALALGSVVGFKVHTGVMVIGAMVGFGLYLIWKRQWNRLWVVILTVAFALLVYLPVNSSAGLPVFAPFEMPRMFAVQEKLGISFLELRRRIYVDHFNILRQWQMDITMLIIFLIGQFGIRNIGWPGVVLILRRWRYLGFFVIGGMAASLFLGSFFIQPVAGADIFNAYLATSLLMWIGAVFVLEALIKKLSVFGVCTLIVIIGVVTIPRWIYKTYLDPQTLRYPKPTIWRGEVDAMKYIRSHTNPEDVITVFNTGGWDSVFPYVSIFTNRPMYLSGQAILERHGISFAHRSDSMKILITTSDAASFHAILKEEGISLLYFYGTPKLGVELENLNLEKVFLNDSLQVYRTL